MSARATHAAPRTLPERSSPTPVKNVPYPDRSVPFPADLIDRAMPVLTDTEWRLLCVVVRQTLGWRSEDGGRKGRDWLTQAQLAGRAGRSRRAVSGAVEGLVRQGILRVQTEAGEPLDTPEARRGYGGRHWFLLGPQAQSFMPYAMPHEASLHRSIKLQSSEVQEGQHAEDGSNAINDLPAAKDFPVPGDTRTIIGHATKSHRYAKDTAGKVENSDESVESEENAEKIFPTTKEIMNKGNSFSEGEPLRGSPSEEAMLREERADEKSAGGNVACAESADDAASAERACQETQQDAGEASGLASLPAGSSLTETGYLQQLVQDAAVDYDEVRRFLLRYQDACQRLFPQQEPPSLAWGKEGKIVAGLLRQHPYERLLRLLKRFLSQIDQDKIDRVDPQRHRAQLHGHGHILVAFSRAIPGLIAQGRQEMAQGIRRTGTDFPIRLWREEDAVTVHGAVGRAVPDAGRGQDSATASDPAKNWRWDKRTGRWIQAGRE